MTETKTKTDVLKDLIWRAAADTDNSYAYISERPEQFKIGDLTRDEKDGNYYIEVRDIVGDRIERIEITEKNLRAEGLIDLIENANEIYRIKRKGIEYERARRVSRIKKRFIAGLIGIVGLTGLGFGGKATREYLNDPVRIARVEAHKMYEAEKRKVEEQERELKKAELEKTEEEKRKLEEAGRYDNDFPKRAEDIIPPEFNRLEYYTLSNGERAIVYLGSKSGFRSWRKNIHIRILGCLA